MHPKQQHGPPWESLRDIVTSTVLNFVLNAPRRQFVARTHTTRRQHSVSTMTPAATVAMLGQHLQLR